MPDEKAVEERGHVRPTRRRRRGRRIAAAVTVAVTAMMLVGCGAGRTTGSPTSHSETDAMETARAAVLAMDDEFLRGVLQSLLPAHADLLADPEGHRLQILLRVPRRDGEDWRFETHDYRVDAEYFYPASTVKSAAAVAALEQLGELQARGVPVTADTAMRIAPQFEQTESQTEDATNVEGGTITVGQEVRKIFLVSDNEAFNRLFELVGRDGVNASMHRLGLDSAHIVHRLSERRTLDENRRFPAIEFVDVDGTVIHRVEEREESLATPNVAPGGPGTDRDVGRAFYEAGELVEGPFDFRVKNRFGLDDLQAFNVLLLRPELGPRLDQWTGELPRLDEGQLRLVRRAMSQLPRESANPSYDPDETPDHWVKFLLPGLRRVVPDENVRVYSKTGRAYGFSIENAYVVDESSRSEGPPERAFFLNVVLYTNANQTLNDDDYEYEAADRFLEDLSEQIARRLWSDG